MKTLKDIVFESLLDDEDDIVDIALVKDFINTNYEVVGLRISNARNKQGKYEVGAEEVIVRNRSITHLTNDLFVWDKVAVFSCTDCKELENLEGSPREAGEFYCKLCNTLTDLTGAPDKARLFDCSYCRNLASLKGAPKKAYNFYCRKCKGKFLDYDVHKVCKVYERIYN